MGGAAVPPRRGRADVGQDRWGERRCRRGGQHEWRPARGAGTRRAACGGQHEGRPGRQASRRARLWRDGAVERLVLAMLLSSGRRCRQPVAHDAAQLVLGAGGKRRKREGAAFGRQAAEAAGGGSGARAAEQAAAPPHQQRWVQGGGAADAALPQGGGGAPGSRASCFAEHFGVRAEPSALQAGPPCSCAAVQCAGAIEGSVAERAGSRLKRPAARCADEPAASRCAHRCGSLRATSAARVLVNASQRCWHCRQRESVRDGMADGEESVLRSGRQKGVRLARERRRAAAGGGLRPPRR